MDSSKRKRVAADDSPNGDDRRKQRRNKEEDRATARDHMSSAAVNDADVEEFFAILERMRATSRCVAAAGAYRRAGAEAEQVRWRPAFVREDFEPGDGAVRDDGGGRREGAGSDNKGEAVSFKKVELDLNTDPEPEGSERTARLAGVQA